MLNGGATVPLVWSVGRGACVRYRRRRAASAHIRPLILPIRTSMHIILVRSDSSTFQGVASTAFANDCVRWSRTRGPPNVTRYFHFSR